ncbi:MAG: hypothetical protein KDN19_24105, partial [Verrucomicrobiae bacterium]|nr:hypothetical protein [Verrucomicrobiae bacterium]
MASAKSVVSQYTYSNDTLGRRAHIGMSGLAFDTFSAPAAVEVAYNTRSEVIGATYAPTETGRRTSVSAQAPTGNSEPKTGNRTFTYAYDAIGNRSRNAVEEGSKKTEATYTTNALNQYTLIQEKSLSASAAPRETSPTHDADGNLVADARFTYRWDAENRLVAAEARDGTHRLEYAYDHQSR